jgi:hypothetical protein
VNVTSPNTGDRAQRLVEAQRVLDAVPSKGVNHQPLLVGGYHFLGRRLQIENTFVEIDDRVDERCLGPGPAH